VLAVSRASRTLFAVAAFAAFAGSFVTTPFAARGAADLAGAELHPARSATPAALTVVLPRRDPFAGAALPAPSTERVSSLSAMPGNTRMPALPALPAFPAPAAGAAIPATLGPLPANAGAPDPPFATSPNAGVRVTAVVTGAHPYALVDDARTARLVTLGDRIGDDAVVGIAADGVRLRRGGTLPLSPSTPATRSQPGDR